MLKQAVEYASATTSPEAIAYANRPGAYAQNRNVLGQFDTPPPPFDPGPTLRGCILLAIRQEPGIDTSHACLKGLGLYQIERSFKGMGLASYTMPMLRKVLYALLAHQEERWSKAAAAKVPVDFPAFVARQAPLLREVSVESTWIPLETPYWKLDDPPRLVKPPRKPRARRP